jgi:hypothetical protein
MCHPAGDGYGANQGQGMASVDSHPYLRGGLGALLGAAHPARDQPADKAWRFTGR